MNKQVVFLVLVFAFSHVTRSQNTPETSPEVIESIMEEIAGNTDDEIDFTSLYEDLYFFYANPVNLNQTTSEELSRLQFLNEFQIKSILNYIYENGPFLSVYELQLLYGFTPEIINRLLPFITISNTITKQNISFKNAITRGKMNYLYGISKF